ncbi:MAG: HD domain-containing protein [Spirochaetales bacterium]|nr:HD domain-containing protein [Spirochaetales bacterium]
MKESEYLRKEKDKITFSVFHTITVFMIITVATTFGNDLVGHNPVHEDFLFLLATSFLTFALLIIKFVDSNIGSFLYIVLALLFIAVFDSMSLFKNDVGILFYSFPMSLCFLFVKRPYNLIFSLIFSILIVMKIFQLPTASFQLKLSYAVLLIFIVYLFVITSKGFSLIKGHQINSLKKVNSTSLRILGRVSELRDSETADHLKRVESFIEILAASIMDHEKYSGYITAEYIEDLKSAAYLHDIGKVGISDAILLKPARLTELEFEEMKRHTIIGYDLLKDAMKEIEHATLYDLALLIARHHHERWDGCGYPDGLRGDEIPLCARLMAIIDVYDALISHRPYKKALTHEEAVAIITDCSGTHFDPLLVERFIMESDKILARSLLIKSAS